MTHHSTVSKLHFILPDMSSAAITSVSPKHWKRTSAFPALDRRGHYLSIFSRSEFAFRPLCFQPFQLPSFGSFFCIFQIRKATASQLFFGLHISLIIFPGLPFIVVVSLILPLKCANLGQRSITCSDSSDVVFRPWQFPKTSNPNITLKIYMFSWKLIKIVVSISVLPLELLPTIRSQLT